MMIVDMEHMFVALLAVRAYLQAESLKGLLLELRSYQLKHLIEMVMADNGML